MSKYERCFPSVSLCHWDGSACTHACVHLFCLWLSAAVPFQLHSSVMCRSPEDSHRSQGFSSLSLISSWWDSGAAVPGQNPGRQQWCGDTSQLWKSFIGMINLLMLQSQTASETFSTLRRVKASMNHTKRNTFKSVIQVKWAQTSGRSGSSKRDSQNFLLPIIYWYQVSCM